MSAPSTPPRILQLRGLLWPVLFCYLYQACASALVALPVLEATRASGIAQFPEPERLLQSEGSLWLLELIAQQRARLLSELGPSVRFLGLICCLSIVPEWRLLRAVVRQHTGAVAASAPVLARLSVLELAFWLLRLPGWLAAALWAFLALSSERSTSLPLLGLLGLTLLPQLGISLLADAAALSVVSGQRPVRRSLRRAWRGLRARSASLAVRYAALRGLSFGTWLGGELLLIALPGAVTAHAGVGFAVHQLALLARVVVHAAWLSWLARQLEA
jgi:hypothetical protein